MKKATPKHCLSSQTKFNDRKLSGGLVVVVDDTDGVSADIAAANANIVEGAVIQLVKRPADAANFHPA